MTSSKLGRAACLAAALALPSLVASPALAQEPSKAELDKARTLFQEAVALAAANNCAAALPKYKAVMQVKTTPQVAFNVAECEERLGHLMAALGNYRVAAAKAADDKKSENVLREVPSRIEAIEARVPKLTITRGKGAEAAAIELDGTEIGSGQIGSPSPIDPGPHVVVARVGGKEYVRETVTLAEKETKTFTVRIDKLPARVVDEPVKDEPVDAGRSRTPGIVVTSVGGALLITGFIGWGLRAGSISTLSGVCDTNNRCPSNAKSTADSGKIYTGLAEVGTFGGIAALGVGIALIATAGPKKKVDDKAAIQLVPAAPGATVGGLSLKGAF